MSSEDVEIKDTVKKCPLLPKGKDSNEVMSQGSDSSSGRDSPALNVDEQRETWTRKADFMLSCVGYAVGLGNIWRFPYLCYANGGGAFLIPYLIMLVICGMPMFYMELAAGQYFSLGPIGVWGAICPLFKGIGMASIVVSFLVCIYYNVIIAWCLYFLAISFRSEVLWKHCNNWWNTENCYEGRLPDVAKNCSNLINTTINATVGSLAADNCTSVNTKDLTSPSLEFWNRYVLELSDGIGNPGSVKWELFLCLVIAWIGIYFCMWKGVKSSGKVVYFTATFPYVVLFILFIRGVTFPGANIGIKYYLTPEWERLKDPKVWVAAATQIFYSMGIGFGSLVAMGSYNKFHNNVFRDAVTISLINCGTSVFAGFVIFSTLGYMSYSLNKPIEEVADSGPGLVFVVYPQAISMMPVSPVWAVLFFIMILTLGLDSQFGMMEAVITGLVDEYKILNKHKKKFIAVACLLCFLPGITHVTQGGAYVLNLFDYQSGGLSLLFLGFFETMSLAWLYGTTRFSKDIEDMVGSRPGRWWKFTWKICAPTVMLGIFFYSISQWSGVSYGTYKYPQWAEFIGWVIALSSMLCIPGFAIYQIYYTPGSFIERIQFLVQPNREILDKIEEREGLERKIPLVKV